MIKAASMAAKKVWLKADLYLKVVTDFGDPGIVPKIGRAACRERV